jgi:hypothetical protein
MSNLSTSLFTLLFLAGGALVGLRLREKLPDHHVDEDSRNIVLLGSGLVVTMSALVLGLLVSSAQAAFDAQRSELTQMSAKAIWLDRVLVHYGPGADKAREAIRGVASSALERVWSPGRAEPAPAIDRLYAEVQALQPATDAQRSDQATAVGIVNDLGQTRWLLYEQRHTRLPTPLLVGLVVWLTFVFVSFGLFAPRNLTVVASLVAAALSVSGAIFLILEMYSPYAGLIRVADDPIRAALQTLGR